MPDTWIIDAVHAFTRQADKRHGCTFMRALFMDFPNYPHVSNMGNEYMFGPVFLIARVTEQGREYRQELDSH